MNNDLISREALKEATKSFVDCDGFNPVWQIIDNAPTVEERPQVEWIDHSEDYGYVECPICGHLTSCCGDKDELHYCWSCGAKLGKGGNNETS